MLTERHEKIIEALVSSGRYQNASEVLREGLRLLEQREEEHAAWLSALAEDDIYEALLAACLRDIAADPSVAFYHRSSCSRVEREVGKRHPNRLPRWPPRLHSRHQPEIHRRSRRKLHHVREHYYVCHEGTDYQWRKVPPGE